MRLFCSSIAMFLFLTASNAQEKPKIEPVAASSAGLASEVRFADDSVVKMTLKEQAIEVSTRFGRLSVPVADIRRIEFGMRLSAENAKKIDAAIALLGSPNQTQRDVAAAELLALRETALAGLRKASNHANREIAVKAAELADQIVQTTPPGRATRSTNDTIVTSDFTIVGRIENPAIKAHSSYFGDSSLNLASLISVRLVAVEKSTQLSVDAAKHGIAQGAWMDTGIDMRTGTALSVSASGMINLQTGDPPVGPDGIAGRGARGFAPNRGGANPNGPAGFPANARGARGNVFTSSVGTLVGKIGESGATFVIGSRFDGTVVEDGKLYLRIVPSPNGEVPSGSFTIRVTTQ